MFLYLDMWTLLRCRNVCRFWQQCIPGNSPALRRTMYVANTSPAVTQPDPSSDEPLTLTFYVGMRGDFEPVEDPWKFQHARDYIVCPPGAGRFCIESKHNIELNPMLNFDMTRAQIKRARAAWKDTSLPKPFWLTMQMGQPPFQTVAIHMRFPHTDVVKEECSIMPHRWVMRYEDPQGVSLGDLWTRIYQDMYWPRMRIRFGSRQDAMLESFKDIEVEGWEDWWAEEGGRPEGLGQTNEEQHPEEEQKRNKSRK